MKAGNDYPVSQEMWKLEMWTRNQIPVGNIITIMELSSPLVSNCTFVYTLSVIDKQN